MINVLNAIFMVALLVLQHSMLTCQMQLQSVVSGGYFPRFSPATTVDSQGNLVLFGGDIWIPERSMVIFLANQLHLAYFKVRKKFNEIFLNLPFLFSDSDQVWNDLWTYTWSSDSWTQHSASGVTWTSPYSPNFGMGSAIWQDNSV